MNNKYINFVQKCIRYRYPRIIYRIFLISWAGITPTSTYNTKECRRHHYHHRQHRYSPYYHPQLLILLPYLRIRYPLHHHPELYQHFLFIFLIYNVHVVVILPFRNSISVRYAPTSNVLILRVQWKRSKMGFVNGVYVSVHHRISFNVKDGTFYTLKFYNFIRLCLFL